MLRQHPVTNGEKETDTGRGRRRERDTLRDRLRYRNRNSEGRKNRDRQGGRLTHPSSHTETLTGTDISRERER